MYYTLSHNNFQKRNFLKKVLVNVMFYLHIICLYKILIDSQRLSKIILLIICTTALRFSRPIHISFIFVVVWSFQLTADMTSRQDRNPKNQYPKSDRWLQVSVPSLRCHGRRHSRAPSSQHAQCMAGLSPIKPALSFIATIGNTWKSEPSTRPVCQD